MENIIKKVLKLLDNDRNGRKSNQIKFNCKGIKFLDNLTDKLHKDLSSNSLLLL